jgi:DNA-binding NtrC family response regulator
MRQGTWRAGLQAAARAHLPLLALRLRAVLLEAVRCSGSAAEADAIADRLHTSLTRPLPPLIRTQVERACRSRPAASDGESHASVPILRYFLELAQGAIDDHAALQGICDVLCERLRASTVLVLSAAPGQRQVVRAGKPWSGEPTTALRALASGIAAWSTSEPYEHAAPIRYGAEVIGSIVCRWLPGGAFDRGSAVADCSGAALACAAALRALIDTASAPQVDGAWGDLLGTSAAADALRRAIESAARAPFPVLIEGESGSGKELVARAIHRLGARKHRRLCTLNCAAISDELLEAELFGHARGAFTGAVAERAGLFEDADGGTLFLDEIGELSARAQAKLLRVLQDGEVRRVGENLPRRVDARVVAATNRRLHQEVERGQFRADLRFRLDVIRITVPPLRDRATDIPVLVAHFWQDAAARVGSRATLSPETIAALTRYDWPGNVRELQNAIAALAVHGPRRGRILPTVLPAHLAGASATFDGSFESARAEFERRFVRAALARTGGHRAQAARALGVSRQGLAKMLRRLNIEDA